jgi:hypothetical protein
MPRHAAPRVRCAGFVGCRGGCVAMARAGRLRGLYLLYLSTQFLWWQAVTAIIGIRSSHTLRNNSRCTWRHREGSQNVDTTAIRRAFSPLRPCGSSTADVHDCPRGVGPRRHPLAIKDTPGAPTGCGDVGQRSVRISDHSGQRSVQTGQHSCAKGLQTGSWASTECERDNGWKINPWHAAASTRPVVSKLNERFSQRFIPEPHCFFQCTCL